jgi:hypothetical protein
MLERSQLRIGSTVEERKRKQSLWEGSALLDTTHHDSAGVLRCHNFMPNKALPSEIKGINEFTQRLKLAWANI